MKRILFALLILALPAQAEEVVLGLSQNRVSITANFDGSEILVFGAVKRETAIDAENPLNVIVTVSGPGEELVVRRKEKWGPIWINRDAVVIDSAPSFYAIATSAPWDEAILDTEDLRYHVSIPRVIRSVGAPQEVRQAEDFAEAVIRIRTANDLYQLNENSVQLTEQTLFRTAVAMPANLHEGDYVTRVYLTRGGEVIATYETELPVRKVGLERFLFNLSRERPLIYGLLSLAIAIIAGWGASEAFRLLRRG